MPFFDRSEFDGFSFPLGDFFFLDSSPYGLEAPNRKWVGRMFFPRIACLHFFFFLPFPPFPSTWTPLAERNVGSRRCFLMSTFFPSSFSGPALLVGARALLNGTMTFHRPRRLCVASFFVNLLPFVPPPLSRKLDSTHSPIPHSSKTFFPSLSFFPFPQAFSLTPFFFFSCNLRETPFHPFEAIPQHGAPSERPFDELLPRPFSPPFLERVYKPLLLAV